tara:strand:+ start:1528 stop:1776 length:249 start_codon:yes stop_codon:yes gene_type:complete
MKNLFFLLAATLMLASCKKDMTCTCTYDAVMVDDEVITESYTSVTNCTDCNGEQQDAFEQACTDLDALMIVGGESLGACVLD